MIEPFSMIIGVIMCIVFTLVILYAQHTTNIWPFRSVRVERAEEKAKWQIQFAELQTELLTRNMRLAEEVRYKEIYILDLENRLMKIEKDKEETEAIMLQLIRK